MSGKRALTRIDHTFSSRNGSEYRRLVALPKTNISRKGGPLVRDKIAEFSGNLIRALENPTLTNASFDPETIHYLARIITDRCRKMLSRLNFP